MNLKRRLSSFSRSRMATATGEKEGTVPHYHAPGLRPHEQGSSIPDGSAILEDDARGSARRGRAASPVHAHGGPTTRRLRAVSPPSLGTNVPVPPIALDDGAPTGSSDAREVSSSDRSNVASGSPQKDTTTDRQTGIPKPGTGTKHWQKGSGDSPAMANGFHRTSVDVHQQRFGSRESGGLLRLEGSKGWTAPRWQGGGDRAQAGKPQSAGMPNGQRQRS